MQRAHHGFRSVTCVIVIIDCLGITYIRKRAQRTQEWGPTTSGISDASSDLTAETESPTLSLGVATEKGGFKFPTKHAQVEDAVFRCQHVWH